MHIHPVSPYLRTLGRLEVYWQGSFHWLVHMVCPQPLALTPRHRLQNEPNPLPGGWHEAVKTFPRFHLRHV